MALFTVCVVEPRRLLVDVLRGDLGLAGTKVGCEQGVCGLLYCAGGWTMRVFVFDVCSTGQQYTK